MLKYYLIKIAKLFSMIFTIFPIQENRILFYSFSGKACSDSPLYIADYLSETKDDFEIIWAVNDLDKWKLFESRGWKFIKYKSIRHLYYGMTSRYIITNTGPYKALSGRKGQDIINTWHGGGAYKKTGMDNPYKNKYQYLYNKNYAQAGVTLFLSSSDAFTKYAIRGAFGYEGEVASVGLPRNDILFSTDKHQEIIDRVKKSLEIQKDDHIILYAPTWRNYEIDKYELLDAKRVIEACKSRFGGEWRFVFRGHNLAKGINLSEDTSSIDATDYLDMQELLIAADILISDYSSCIWDFSIMKKPCYLFTPDLDDYTSTFAFYTDIDKWGFYVCKDNTAIEKSIQNFNFDEYKNAIENNYLYFGNRETGDACKYVYDYIKNKRK